MPSFHPRIEASPPPSHKRDRTESDKCGYDHKRVDRCRHEMLLAPVSVRMQRLGIVFGYISEPTLPGRCRPCALQLAQLRRKAPTHCLVR